MALPIAPLWRDQICSVWPADLGGRAAGMERQCVGAMRNIFEHIEDLVAMWLPVRTAMWY